ncbi:ABC transporter ATP-binding protein [Candidatus Parcubacteria bacterium]|nr:MAG: ABC transporter ATP-binding protein [Candidatus Parcubacteria bacterium]
MIIVENLVKKFKTGDSELIALKGVSFKVAEGQFLAITGKSGSGKSTLLYQMGALDFPTNGSVYIDGKDIVKMGNRERTELRLMELGYVFQDYALLPELTAVENVMAPLMMQGAPKKQARMISEESLRKVGLEHKLYNKPSQLSGGEQQRVSIARAIGHNPKIIFADEPTANLDSETSKIVLDIFLGLHKKGQTIVMVTHESEYAVLAERIIRLSDGEIISDEKNKQ